MVVNPSNLSWVYGYVQVKQVVGGSNVEFRVREGDTELTRPPTKKGTDFGHLDNSEYTHTQAK